ncbi:histidine acid phosphatase-like protein [Saccharata proteae CBS 121410]|uniref:Histidine acid phosphatase-like protein n=1 Tax=Saccharata proteae CBS 121410 TaxID=1314787 RepID=A0A9P4M064_9PEZI|nr:histidine acid phosphatase-like protein [Saccharata proteae CBS 121410]
MEVLPLNQSALGWYAPASTWINNLAEVVNGTGTHGFIFNNTEPDVYGGYDWCNMPHVRTTEYPTPGDDYLLTYVEVIHRHHKRTPYQANTFPKENYDWYCSDEELFYYADHLGGGGRSSAQTYWQVAWDESYPLAPEGFNGTCQFPQITGGGLDDSAQHGLDLFDVYHDLLKFLPNTMNGSVKYRVTNNVITSQVAGKVVGAMYYPAWPTPLQIQPDSIDSLEPAYSCPASSDLYNAYAVGSTNSSWLAHLDASQPLFNELDAISGVDSDDSGWHQSWDHYFDNLSARQCHDKPLPCNESLPAKNNPGPCVSQEQADTVYRLGQYEYSYQYRDNPQSLPAAVSSFGIWCAELAEHIRDSISGNSNIVYRHNVAHDGSVARLLSILQVNVMVWPGMGSEVVFELYQNRKTQNWHIRVLWGGKVLTSSSPTLGRMDMLDVSVFLAYIDGLVGVKAAKIPELCGLD